jgi:hypothetical protein
MSNFFSSHNLYDLNFGFFLLGYKKLLLVTSLWLGIDLAPQIYKAKTKHSPSPPPLPSSPFYEMVLIHKKPDLVDP